jgi:hypothetical protein
MSRAKGQGFVDCPLLPAAPHEDKIRHRRSIPAKRSQMPQIERQGENHAE